MAARVHPLITWTQYQDLLAARGVVEPGLNASVACRMSPYWVQYVLGLRPFSRRLAFRISDRTMSRATGSVEATTP